MAEATIHPTAILNGTIRLGEGTTVGPFAILDGEITLGANCTIGPSVHLLGRIVAGDGNRFHSGCVIGDAPQHLGYKGEPTGVSIGTNNTFREFVTIHRGMPSGTGNTVIGDGNFIMASSHVAHDGIVGNGTIFANGAVIGGHATVGDGAFLSGNSAVHQFCRVGRLAFVSGTTAISQDLPPFWIAQELNTVHGINIVGMKRAGFASSEIQAVRKAFKMLTREARTISASLDIIEAELGTVPAVRETIDFIRTTKRGICSTTRLHGSNRED